MQQEERVVEATHIAGGAVRVEVDLTELVLVVLLGQLLRRDTEDAEKKEWQEQQNEEHQEREHRRHHVSERLERELR